MVLKGDILLGFYFLFFNKIIFLNTVRRIQKHDKEYEQNANQHHHPNTALLESDSKQQLQNICRYQI